MRVRTWLVLAALATTIIAGTAIAIAMHGGDGATCRSLLHPGEASALPQGFEDGLAEADITVADLRSASEAEASQLQRVLSLKRGWDDSDMAGLSACALTYSGQGHRVSPEAHRAGRRAVQVDDVAALLVWIRKSVDKERCLGPSGSCPDTLPQKVVVCVDLFEAHTGISLGNTFCYDD
jgi:hypothetical protein